MGTLLHLQAMVNLNWNAASTMAAIMVVVTVAVVLLMTRTARWLNPMATRGAQAEMTHRIHPALIGHTLPVLPYCLRVVSASLASFDCAIEEAAISLGSHPRTGARPRGDPHGHVRGRCRAGSGSPDRHARTRQAG